MRRRAWSSAPCAERTCRRCAMSERPRWEVPQKGDVLVMAFAGAGLRPRHLKRRVVAVTERDVVYWYLNARAVTQTVTARRRTWDAAVRKALRQGGRYIPVEEGRPLPAF